MVQYVRLNDSLKILPARFFKTASGTEPVREWLKVLDKGDSRIIGGDIRTVEYGWPIGMLVCRSIRGYKDLWEVRSRLSGGRIARVIFHMSGAEGSMKAMPEHPHRGSSFEDFLKEEGILEASTTTTVKRVLAWQIAEAMRTQHLTKLVMAARMHTSISQLERLLDPEKTGVSLETIQRAAAVVGRELRVELV
jgi:hypothetical protein